MQITTPVLDSQQPDGKGRSRKHFGLALLIGLLPLALLAAVIGGTLTIIVVIRPIIATASFFEQQYILAIIAIVGLTLAAIIYAFVCKHILRRIRALHLAGHKTSVNGGLWALFITSLAVALPVALGFFVH